jgi:hypothetical protein
MEVGWPWGGGGGGQGVAVCRQAVREAMIQDGYTGGCRIPLPSGGCEGCFIHMRGNTQAMQASAACP